jgi:uncharacterized membrane protein
LDAIVTFLFKYRPAAFAGGEIAYDRPAAWWLVVLLAAAAAGFALFAYLRLGSLPPRDRAALAAIRSAALLLLIWCLAAPVLVVATAVSQRNALAILIDDSRSMGITDAAGGRSRHEAALAAFAPEGQLAARLGERFQVRVFGFSEALRPGAGAGPGATGRVTDLALALESARDALGGGVSLAGVVVVSDGGDNAGGALTDALLRYRAAGIPVHTVGAGSERLTRDVAIEPALLPERVLRHSAVVIDVRITQRGYAGTTLPVVVEDEGTIVGRAEVRLPRDGDAVTVSVSFTAESPGPRRIRVSVPVQGGEQVTGNNTREALISVEDRRERILYFEGEPRYELAFLRRAVAADRQLELVTLLRSARDKYLRLDVGDSTELVAGFPTTRQELFGFRGLVIGNVEAAAFTRDQLRMLGEFARVRGGGVLMLGGRLNYSAGGYAGTPVADALPVELPREADTTWFRRARIRPTPAGRRHPITRLASDDAADRARWDTLPPLAMAHRLREAKPGAVVLLEGESEGERLVALAVQRYGRGRTAAFAVLDAWQWRMHASLGVADRTHETLWRQLLRWMVAETPGTVALRPGSSRVLAGRPVAFTAEVTDSAYIALNGATVTATVRGPDGAVTTVPLAWAAERDGEYRGSFAPPSDGLYDVTVEALSGGRSVGSARAWIEAGDPRLEFARAERQTALLRRVAEETGGRYYDLDGAARLVEDAPYTSAGVTVTERLDLWDMPAVLIALVLLLGAEWSYRRMRGLA